MTETNVAKNDPRKREAGIALVLAIMALMLLTFLGLTLAATTSTELQIATNYRWSQQALYNAEAGIEAGKVILRNIPSTVSWATLLPVPRGGTWTTVDGTTATQPTVPAGSLTADDWGNAPRNFENAGCDDRGGNVGFGVVLNDVGSTLPQGVMQDKTVIFGQRLNGAVTLWVRRDYGPLVTTGQISDSTADVALILTAEGVAPYSDGSSSLAFARANQATRILESRLLRAADATDPCEAYRAQAGNGVSGSGFAVCGALKIDCSGAGGGKEGSLLDGAVGLGARQEGGGLGFGSGAVGTMDSKQDPANPGTCVQ